MSANLIFDKMLCGIVLCYLNVLNTLHSLYGSLAYERFQVISSGL